MGILWETMTAKLFNKRGVLWGAVLFFSGLLFIMNGNAQDSKWKIFNQESTMFPALWINDILAAPNGKK